MTWNLLKIILCIICHLWFILEAECRLCTMVRVLKVQSRDEANIVLFNYPSQLMQMDLFYYLGDLLDETEVLEWLIQQQSSISDEDVVER